VQKSADFVSRQNRKINRKILSADIDHVLFWTIKSANLLDTGHHGDCLKWQMNIHFSYLFCLLLYDVYFRSLDAEKIMQLSLLWFAFSCCASMKLADIVQSCKRQNRPWFNDFIGRFSRPTKPRSQKLANFFDLPTCPLVEFSSNSDCGRDKRIAVKLHDAQEINQTTAPCWNLTCIQYEITFNNSNNNNNNFFLPSVKA